MKIWFTLLLLFPLYCLSQEQWSTLNITGKLNDKWSIATEGEQRYSFSMNKTRYFHYDVGAIKTLSPKWKVGLFFRELYEIKNGVRVIEKRPHIDGFYTANKHWKFRTRLEYQIKEIAQDVLRFRIRPNYDFKIFKNFDPYIQNEFNFTKDGFTRNRFNAGVTINYHHWQIQPGYLLESLNKHPWQNTNVLWINTKLNF